ncbi:MAG: RimK/LysX family protein [Xanthomonadales bacterium]|nr:RimK/LysX family protein [Xanthomonadales bacterium]
MSPARALLTVGWREWLALPALGIAAIRAKIDTGARSSALHVEALERFRAGDREWVRFTVLPARDAERTVSCEAEIIDVRPVTDSGGRTTERPFIRTLLAVAGQSWPIEINLTRRTHMLFPMLLGRTAMAGRMLVDPSASFLLGEPAAP